MQSLENIDVVIKFSWAQFATIADAVEAGFRELDSHVANFPRRWRNPRRVPLRCRRADSRAVAAS